MVSKRAGGHMIKSYLFKLLRHSATLMIAKMIPEPVLDDDDMNMSENLGKE
ncbi:hypothetical protein PAAG_11919 [Paracoccidioides lutzii Pb01]|uniref:Uncharacterized protein n=1 Tax=Paracoccidioides lutzii (strain ATCC MYA-826 / Pb01) TaxID=502779 RepID=A0A0A2V4Q4_PARBA|nr:hypothetical protein PAAG_11919 [Paracoccidioides lutzii Pb01]KGQ01342.1 hypothetical protein PAAG_11919 [Paracoccidioides lutzii Pb01]